MKIKFVYPRQNPGQIPANLAQIKSAWAGSSQTDLLVLPPYYLTGLVFGPDLLRPEVITSIEASLLELRSLSHDRCPLALLLPAVNGPRLVIIGQGEILLDRNLPGPEAIGPAGPSRICFSLLPSYLDSPSLMADLSRQLACQLILGPAAGDTSSQAVYLGEFFSPDLPACTQLAQVDQEANQLTYFDLDLAGTSWQDLDFCLLDQANQLPARRIAKAEYPLYPGRDQDLVRGLIIPAEGLACRLRHLGEPKLLLGLSGGMDSALALVYARRALLSLNRKLDQIQLYYLRGFASSQESHDLARSLAHGLGLDLVEIDIRPACLQHFKDIGHDPNQHDLTYENTQARERTQILMDLANQESGIVLGTGSLSEAALGWCTYNGDHMSMYHVNGGVPKSLSPSLLRLEADLVREDLPNFAQALQRVAASPPSPELLPGDSGPAGNGADPLARAASQLTESLLGPYKLHDYYLWQFRGLTRPWSDFLPELFAAGYFADISDQDKLAYGRRFIWRYYGQQFKRRTMPDSPQLYPQDLAASNDHRLASDLKPELFLQDLDLAEQIISQK